MATALEQLQGLGGVLQAIQGTSQRQRGTQTSTQQTNVSDQGVQELITQILSGPGGVASIGNAARSTGLYNSTTEQRELGNLYSRAANQAELARSPTTTTTTTDATVQTPGIGLGSLGGLMAAAQGVNAVRGLFGGESGIGSALGSLFGGGGTAGGDMLTSAALSPAVTEGVANTLGAVAPGLADAGAGLASAFGGATAAGGALGNVATAAVPGIGSFLGGLFGGKDQATDPTSLAMTALSGAAALGPIGLVAAPLAAVAGGFLSDASVVCTALMKKGLVSQKLHNRGEVYLSEVEAVTKVGYWMWGVPVAKKIDAGSVFWTRFTLPIVKSYLHLIAIRNRKLVDYVAYPLGTVAMFIGEPFCKLLGRINCWWTLHKAR